MRLDHLLSKEHADPRLVLVLFVGVGGGCGGGALVVAECVAWGGSRVEHRLVDVLLRWLALVQLLVLLRGGWWRGRAFWWGGVSGTLLGPEGLHRFRWLPFGPLLLVGGSGVWLVCVVVLVAGRVGRQTAALGALCVGVWSWWVVAG